MLSFFDLMHFRLSPAPSCGFLKKSGQLISISFDQSEIAIILVYNSIQFGLVHQFSNLNPPQPRGALSPCKGPFFVFHTFVRFLMEYCETSVPIFLGTWCHTTVMTPLTICILMTTSESFGNSAMTIKNLHLFAIGRREKNIKYRKTLNLTKKKFKKS